MRIACRLRMSARFPMLPVRHELKFLLTRGVCCGCSRTARGVGLWSCSGGLSGNALRVSTSFPETLCSITCSCDRPTETLSQSDIRFEKMVVPILRRAMSLPSSHSRVVCQNNESNSRVYCTSSNPLTRPICCYPDSNVFYAQFPHSVVISARNPQSFPLSSL